jgi:hypothetical protein
MVLLILLSLSFSFSYPRQKPAESQAALVFTHATIIDTSGGPNKPDMTVFITGDRITDVKKEKSLELSRFNWNAIEMLKKLKKD